MVSEVIGPQPQIAPMKHVGCARRTQQNQRIAMRLLSYVSEKTGFAGADFPLQIS